MKRFDSLLQHGGFLGLGKTAFRTDEPRGGFRLSETDCSISFLHRTEIPDGTIPHGIGQRGIEFHRFRNLRQERIAGLFTGFEQDFLPASVDRITVRQGNGPFAQHRDDPPDADLG